MTTNSRSTGLIPPGFLDGVQKARLWVFGQSGACDPSWPWGDTLFVNGHVIDCVDPCSTWSHVAPAWAAIEIPLSILKDGKTNTVRIADQTDSKDVSNAMVDISWAKATYDYRRSDIQTDGPLKPAASRTFASMAVVGDSRCRQAGLVCSLAAPDERWSA